MVQDQIAKVIIRQLRQGSDCLLKCLVGGHEESYIRATQNLFVEASPVQGAEEGDHGLEPVVGRFCEAQGWDKKGVDGMDEPLEELNVVHLVRHQAARVDARFDDNLVVEVAHGCDTLASGDVCVGAVEKQGTERSRSRRKVVEEDLPLQDMVLE